MTNFRFDKFLYFFLTCSNLDGIYDITIVFLFYLCYLTSIYLNYGTWQLLSPIIPKMRHTYFLAYKSNSLTISFDWLGWNYREISIDLVFKRLKWIKLINNTVLLSDDWLIINYFGHLIVLLTQLFQMTDWMRFSSHARWNTWSILTKQS